GLEGDLVRLVARRVLIGDVVGDGLLLLDDAVKRELQDAYRLGGVCHGVLLGSDRSVGRPAQKPSSPCSSRTTSPLSRELRGAGDLRHTCWSTKWDAGGVWGT